MHIIYSFVPILEVLTTFARTWLYYLLLYDAHEEADPVYDYYSLAVVMVFSWYIVVQPLRWLLLKDLVATYSLLKRPSGLPGAFVPGFPSGWAVNITVTAVLFLRYLQDRKRSTTGTAFFILTLLHLMFCFYGCPNHTLPQILLTVPLAYIYTKAVTSTVLTRTSKRFRTICASLIDALGWSYGSMFLKYLITHF